VSNVQVKNIPDDLHDLLRERATHSGLTISDYVLDLIRRDLRRPPRSEWLTALRALPRTSITRDELLAQIDEAREKRAPHR
jgi:plasmid stability protein